ncbi:MAG: methionine--tRNA ligase [Nitrospinota bacterium]
MQEKFLVITSALPYANGSIHLGHLVEYIQTDIYVRFNKMLEERTTLYFCADDTHGAPIMIRAKNENIRPESIIERYHLEHQQDFDKFRIEFDNYHSTNSVENREISESIFGILKSKGHIVKKAIKQTYCEHDKMFLPDRFIKGTCPKCAAKEQYGDACESCGSHYDSTDLKDSRCSLCNNRPTEKESTHYFFRVSDFKDEIIKFVNSDAIQLEVKNFLQSWLKDGLRDWDITRDGPYFGFLIPGESDKYFYVWLDAPIGYISSAKNWATKNNVDFDKLWHSDETQIEHFIGKDIVYFHTLFWIPTLKGSGYSIPNKIRTHGFLTINGEKMSKSKGTLINGSDYLKFLDPEHLRFYYATKLKNSIDDIDLNFEDFMFRVNSDFVNKIANLGSRVISMLNKNSQLENRLSDNIAAGGEELIKTIENSGDKIKALYSDVEYSKLVKIVSKLADLSNFYIDQAKPWELIGNKEKLREVLTVGVNAFRLITIYIKPIVPIFAEKVEKILNVDPLKFDDVNHRLTGKIIGKFEKLSGRVENKNIEQLVEKMRQSEPSKSEESSDSPPTIDFDTFSKIDLRTALVLEATKIKKSEKLLKLKVSLGDSERTIVAGIGKHYSIDSIVGKKVIIVANLKPTKLMGVTSEGMLLAASDDENLFIPIFDNDLKAGLKVS